MIIANIRKVNLFQKGIIRIVDIVIKNIIILAHTKIEIILKEIRIISNMAEVDIKVEIILKEKIIMIIMKMIIEMIKKNIEIWKMKELRKKIII